MPNGSNIVTSASGSAALQVIAVGLMDYSRCLELQRALHAEVASGKTGPCLILVEHPPVLTLGKHSDPAHLLGGSGRFEAQGIAVVATDRGGQVTAHMPGQLVAYPILRLADFHLTPRRYVALLERAVIATLAKFGVCGRIDEAYPGVWVGQDKICALGVRVKDRASLHGVAINVCNELGLFEQIVPCGLYGRGVINLASLMGRPVATAEVASALIIALTERLELAVRLSDPSPACNGETESLQFKL